MSPLERLWVSHLVTIVYVEQYRPLFKEAIALGPLLSINRKVDMELYNFRHFHLVSAVRRSRCDRILNFSPFLSSGLSPKKVGDDIAKATQDWKGTFGISIHLDFKIES